MQGLYTEANPANFTKGRAGKKVELIILHTMGGFFNGTISWFKNPIAKASTHFLVGYDGKVAQMVPKDDTAWHATNLDINQRSIGIEHEDMLKPYNVRPDALYETSSQLVADIAKQYNIPLDRTHILKHSEVYKGKPDCPGGLDIDRIINRAKQINGITPPPIVTPPTPSLPIIPMTRNVTIIADKGLNIRSGPTTAAKNIVKVLQKNTSITVEGYVIGESVANNNIWWKVKGSQEYAWSGATNFIPTLNSAKVAETPPPAPVNPEELKLRIDALEGELKRVNQTLTEANTANEKLRNENTSLSTELAKFGDLNFETVKNANESLVEQNEELLRKNKELTNQRDDAYIKAFSGWKLAEVPEGGKGFGAGLSFVTQVLRFNRKSHYVVGYKEGATLYNPNAEQAPISAEDATAEVLQPAA